MYILIEDWVRRTEGKEEVDAKQRLNCVCESLYTLSAYMHEYADDLLVNNDGTEYWRNDFYVHLVYDDELQSVEIDLHIEPIYVLSTE